MTQPTPRQLEVLRYKLAPYICRLIGHKVVLVERPWKKGWGRWQENCARCHETDVFEICYAKRWFNYLGEPWKRFKKWCRPCTDCGKRFGRHDETQDHCPF